MDQRLIRILVTIAVVALGLVYVLVTNSMETKKAYQGQVIDKIKKAKFGKWFSMNTTGRDHKYYLVVQDDAGETFKVRVARSVYSRFLKGDRIVKNAGERYPKNESSSHKSLTWGEIGEMITE